LGRSYNEHRAASRRFFRNRDGQLSQFCDLLGLELEVVTALALGDEATVGDQVEVEQGRPRSRVYHGPTAEERAMARQLLGKTHGQ
jgi:hypothetical protein